MIEKIISFIRNIVRTPRRMPAKYLAIGLASIPSVAILLYGCVFFWPKTITYSFAQDKTCFSNPTLLPTLLSVTSTQDYSLKNESGLKIAGTQLYSGSSCVEIQGVPDENTSQKVSLSPFSNPFIAKVINVRSSELPKLSSTIKDGELTSTKEKLSFRLTQPDRTFSYKVAAGKTSSECSIDNDQLSCDLSGLKLAQSRTYTLNFERYFRDQPVRKLYEVTIKTVDPVMITGSSLAQNVTVYDSPKTIEITTNKTLASFQKVDLLNTTSGKSEAVETSISGKKLILKPGAALSREATYRVNIVSLTASDKGFLSAPYTLEFNTSGGPKVIATNVGSYGVSQNTPIRIDFDYPILPGQDLGSLLSLRTAADPIATSSYTGDKSITLTPASALPRCTTITVQLASGLRNIHGIESTLPWSYSFRTLCQEVFSIGTSAQGRPITAYKFGSGPSTVLYVGATHGDEIGSKYLLDSWINELEANYPQIPAHRTIIVIPMLNPDAVAAGSRTNAQSVDLNRNFPSNNWKSDVVMPGGNLLKNGGGTSPLSEPESKAIADYIIASRPRLVLTYHSQGSMVIANEAGDSAPLGEIYGSSSGYWSRTESQLGATFAYDTTGAMENWLYDKQTIPTLLIELSTHSYNEFYKNKAAMWAMAKL